MSDTIENQVAEPIKRAGRGFILNVANSPEEVQAIKEGKNVSFEISPVFAANEQAAIAFIESLGKSVASIASLEILELQLSLLYKLAEEEKLEILREEFEVTHNPLNPPAA